MFRIVRLRAASPYEVAEQVYDSLCVGRSSQNEMTTDDRMISSSHARLFVRDTTLQVVDLDSRNGTEVNGERLGAFEPREVRDGDEIDFAGRLAFRVELDRDAPWPTITVASSPGQSSPDARETILRVLALPGGLTPVLDAGRLLSLQRLILRLTDPTRQRNGGQWLETLTSGAARVLRVPEVLLVRTRPSGTLDVVYPRGATLEPRADAVAECLRRGQSAAIDVTNTALDTLGGDTHATVDGAMCSPSSLVVPTLCGVLAPAADAAPWGLLYAASPGAARSFDDQDVWLIDALGKLVGNLFAQVSASQILARHRGRLPALAEHAEALSIVGTAPLLGAALETLATLAREQTPVLVLAARGTEPERWAELAHRLSARSGARFERVDLERLAPGALHDAVSSAMSDALGGTLALEHLDGLDPDNREALRELLETSASKRVRLIVTSGLPPDVLAHPSRLGPELVASLCPAVVRVPGLAERRHDIPVIVDHLLRQARRPPVDERVTWTFAEFDFPGELAELRASVAAVVAADADRDPVSTERVLAASLYRAAVGHGTAQSTSPQNSVGFHPLADAGDRVRPELALTPLADALYQAGLLD